MTIRIMAQIPHFVFILFAMTTGLNAQTAVDETSEFETSTAIANTKVLFAIGAREGEQQIRGSFGWPTFQEGFVEGVYFRFDPDGYARFSTSPRLDENVFEVHCAPGTTACIARKTGIEIGLTIDGRVQLVLSGIGAEDSFFVTDKKSELPLPPTVLEPLDARLETLLASSSELVVKRQLEVIQSVRLNGFNAVVTYLRWIAQQQSPRVFPRGWPVPSQIQDQFATTTTQLGASNINNRQTERNVTTFQTAFGRPSNPLQQSVEVQRTGLNSTPGLDPLQQQILALQAEIARMRVASEQVDPIPTSPNELAGDRPLQGFSNDQKPVLPVNSLRVTDPNVQDQDSSISFVQQAQGRALPEPTGLQAFGIQLNETNGRITPATVPGSQAGDIVIPNDYGRDEISAANAQAQIKAMFQQNEVLNQELAHFRNRLNQLEIGMINLQRQTMTDLNTIRQEAWEKTTSNIQEQSVLEPSVSDIGGVELVQGREPMAMVPEETDANIDQLELLEKLLMERLSKRSTGKPQVLTDLTQPVRPIETETQQQEEIPLQRSIVEELLSELGSNSSSNDVLQPTLGEAEAESGGEKPEVTAQAGPEKAGSLMPKTDDGFITLSDYINKVLKAEGLEGGVAKSE